MGFLDDAQATISSGGLNLLSGGGGGFSLSNALGTNNGFNAGQAPGTVAQLGAGQAGYNSNMVAQNALLAALQAQSQGQGPNPAQALLNQQTNQNIQQNSGMIASQKGINPAQAQRQAEMNAAGMSQQAAGQGASMNAQQQVNAQNQMVGLTGNVGSQALNQQNIAQQGFYAPQAINAGVAAGNQKTNAGLIGGVLGGAGSAMGMMAHGGTVQAYADGGTIGNASLDPMSNATAFFNSQQAAPVPNMSMSPMSKLGGGSSEESAASGATGGGSIGQAAMMAHGGSVPIVVSPGEKYIPPSQVQQVASGQKSIEQAGEKIPGKANVKGDSYANDTVPKTAEAGGIVIPRHIMTGKSPGDAAKAFVEQELAKQAIAGKKNFPDGGKIAAPEADPAPQDNWFASLEKGAGKMAMPFVQPFTGKTPDEYNKSVDEAVDQSYQPQQVAQETQSLPIQGQPPQAEAPAPQPVDQPQTHSDPYGIQAQMGAMGQGVAEQKAGLGMEAAATGAAGKQEADVANQAAAQQQQMMTDYQKNNQDVMNHIKDASDAYQNQKVDPNHYWASKDSVGKISSVIGLILGGMSSGLTGQENPAMKFMNAQIDRDIHAQTLDMDKQKNLMSYNFQMLGNMRDATMMTKAMQLDIVKSKMDALAASTKDPVAQARLMQESGKIDQQIAPMIGQLSMRKTLLGGAEGGGGGVAPEMKIKAIVPPEQQQAYFKDLAEMQGSAKARDNILAGFDEVSKLNTVGERILNPIDSKRRIEQIKGRFLPTLSKDTAGKYTESDAEAIGHMFDTLGQSPEGMAKARKDLESLSSSKMNYPMLKSIGITPETMSRYGQSGAKKIQMGAPKI